jgi:peptidyl-prolyl cis-trans isomerase C
MRATVDAPDGSLRDRQPFRGRLIQKGVIMKRIILTALIIAAFMFSVTACKNLQEQAAAGKPAGKNLSDDETAAWVNGKPIAKKLIDDIISSMPPMYQSQVKTPEGMRSLLDNVIAVELVYEKADKEGFTKKPEVQEKVQNVMKQVVYAAYIEDAMKAGASDEAAMRKFYDEHKDQFATKDQVQASHILFKAESKDGEDPAKAKACADVLAKAKKPGADFGELAKKYSDDSSKDKGGDLGYFERERMVKPFAEAAFAMKVGEISACVKSPFGYHIIKKTGEKGPEQKSFEDVKDKIGQIMSQQGQQKAYEEIVSNLKKGADIKYNEKLMGIAAAPKAEGAPTAQEIPAPPELDKKVKGEKAKTDK